VPHSVPCPNKDHGICTIPDPALVVSEQGISVVRPDLAEHLMEISGEPQALRPLNLAVSYDDLVADVAGASVGFAGQSESQTQSPLQSRLQSLVRPAGRTVVVNCSCGDIFVADI
jgi:hypothetical protein